MADQEPSTLDSEWLLKQLQQPVTFRDRINFYIKTRFNTRLLPGYRYVYMKGGSYPRNFVYNGLKNTKYNIFTFLPCILYEQFTVFMNLFYLAISLSQLIPALAIENPITYFGPLTFVLFVQLLKEGSDDYKRYRRDGEANSQKYEILTNDGLKEIEAARITVGTIVKLHKSQRVPADMILLRSSEANGSTFIRTDQLDGETDWKLKKAVYMTQHLASAEEMINMDIVCNAEPPRQDIYSFNGRITHYQLKSATQNQDADNEAIKKDESNGQSKKRQSPNSVSFSLDDSPMRDVSDKYTTIVEPVSIDNAIWMNTIIAAGTVYGLVIYIGKEARASLNARRARYKISCFDWEVNLMSKALFTMLVAMSFTMVIPKGFVGQWYIWLIKFLLLFSTIIPISLRINLDIAKYTYSWSMSMDNEIPGTVARTTLIPEDLGRISYLLTDKTGTLTQNIMNLEKIHIGRALFHAEGLETIRQHVKNYFDNFEVSNAVGGLGESINSNLQSVYSLITQGSTDSTTPLRSSRTMGKSAIHLPHKSIASNQEIETKICLAILSLAICHNVTPTMDNGILAYQASSPDEIALVTFARLCNVELKERDEKNIVLKINDNLLLKYKILIMFPFSSETKRMGIIIEDEEAGMKFFFCKGAESALVNLLQPRGSFWLNEECDNMARTGLRTLVFGYRVISDQEYTAFETRYRDARLSLKDREEKDKRAIAYLEHDLILVALTGVQDQLQLNVRSTLESLRNAGIRIWMLTGDKVDTALCIAISAGIKDKSHTVCQITRDTARDKDEIKQQLENFSMGPTSTVLVVDSFVVAISIKEFAQFFIRVAASAPAVLCCRCTPGLKGQLVKFIKQLTGKRTCAIGDGDNDVPMIMEADVGIGIVGKEGMQASLSADYSIDKFYYIKRMILWHGRNSYKKSAALTHFIIHRGMIIAVMQAIFSAMYFYMPLAFFQGWLQIGFSTYYTTMPILSLVLDYEMDESVVMLFPELYQTLRSGRTLSVKTFLIWVWISVFQGAILMLGAIILFENSMLSLVSISCTSLFVLELLNIYSEIHVLHPLTLASMITTAVVYFYSILILRNYFDFSFVATTAFAWKVIIITLSGWFPVYLFKLLQKILQPPQYSKLSV
ncbi:bifunctional P-type ATPase/HAD superfamily/P-type ATPase [Babesia duncani]|uniref:Phospholipid-transporting ATPase n=1 Tax=Babesia duncani TaxID=323732 RepID=A0AAD9PIW0_9APIC|nr:bifunctional P-type ATPase/HAD superfamily/P-type ATPase [Babesia duncani]